MQGVVLFGGEVKSDEIAYGERKDLNQPCGVELLSSEDIDLVAMIPLNAQGTDASTFIGIPKDPRVLREIGNEFLKLAEKVMAVGHNKAA